MKAREFIDFLTEGISVSSTTCDTIKFGDPEKEIKKVAVAMNPTVDILTESNSWGADMLIVHEPIFFNHMDEQYLSAVAVKKKEIAEKNGMVIYRYHDHPHAHVPDMITAGFISALGIEGELGDKIKGGSLFLAKDPVSASELAICIDKKLAVSHIRIAGERNRKCSRFALCLGAPGDMYETLIRDDVDCLVVGEVSEWRVAEYARDAAALGINKSVLVLGHVGSERDGMLLMKNSLEKLFPSIEFKYFNTPEVYTYTDENPIK